MMLPELILRDQRYIHIHTHIDGAVSLNLCASNGQQSTWASFTAAEARAIAARLIEAADMVAPAAAREAV